MIVGYCHFSYDRSLSDIRLNASKRINLISANIQFNLLFVLQEVQDMTEATQDIISDRIKDTTSNSAEQMSSADVHSTVQIIEEILDLEISDRTLDNLVATVDNVQTNTEVDELRKDGTSDKLRESAVKIVSEIADQGTNTFKPLNSVGESVIL